MILIRLTPDSSNWFCLCYDLRNIEDVLMKHALNLHLLKLICHTMLLRHFDLDLQVKDDLHLKSHSLLMPNILFNNNS
ncbi:hypothetical protein CI610_02926 [invertebrate metagenome]|uniref:Uncharacterized protein n=1 Tax=invertebrate metagenome TaxID=1711999 RepID=A0A2H9T4L3_9ZZZZ